MRRFLVVSIRDAEMEFSQKETNDRYMMIMCDLVRLMQILVINKSCELIKSGETLLSSLNWWKFVCASNGKQPNADLRVPLKLHSAYRCSEPLHVIYRFCCVSSSHFICCTHFISIYLPFSLSFDFLLIRNCTRQKHGLQSFLIGVFTFECFH